MRWNLHNLLDSARMYDPFTARWTAVDPTEYFQENGGIPYIRWNSTEGLRTSEGVILSPASVFAHEADHAIDDLTNAKAHSDWRVDTSCKEYSNAEEKRVISGTEQKTARANGEIKPGQITRKNHFGHTVYTVCQILRGFAALPAQSIPGFGFWGQSWVVLVVRSISCCILSRHPRRWA